MMFESSHPPFCIHHPARRARAACVRCGDYICEECLSQSESGALCPRCAGLPRQGEAGTGVRNTPVARTLRVFPGTPGEPRSARCSPAASVRGGTRQVRLPPGRACRGPLCQLQDARLCGLPQGSQGQSPLSRLLRLHGRKAGAPPLPLPSRPAPGRGWGVRRSGCPLEALARPGLPAPPLSPGTTHHVPDQPGGQVSLGAAVFFLSTILYATLLIFAAWQVGGQPGWLKKLGVTGKNLKAGLSWGLLGAGHLRFHGDLPDPLGPPAEKLGLDRELAQRAA